MNTSQVILAMNKSRKHPDECFFDQRINKCFTVSQGFLIFKTEYLPWLSPQQGGFPTVKGSSTFFLVRGADHPQHFNCFQPHPRHNSVKAPPVAVSFIQFTKLSAFGCTRTYFRMSFPKLKLKSSHWVKDCLPRS